MKKKIFMITLFLALTLPLIVAYYDADTIDFCEASCCADFSDSRYGGAVITFFDDMQLTESEKNELIIRLTEAARKMSELSLDEYTLVISLNTTPNPNGDFSSEGSAGNAVMKFFEDVLPEDFDKYGVADFVIGALREYYGIESADSRLHVIGNVPAMQTRICVGHRIQHPANNIWLCRVQVIDVFICSVHANCFVAQFVREIMAQCP
ncbi:MAG: hypothetical protein FWC20_08775 [Oscillospiraceae bacterium]|nr:hypothetical protein [Oscillospiraceae bacterium]MCL2279482.1 hypothetical protein [Oscillospiraceae bacterium]